MEIHLASMENITCWAFRNLCNQASDSYTGMLSLTNLVKRNNAWEEVDTYPIKGQRQWIQFATSKESECKEFIIKLEQHIKIHPEKDNIYGLQLNCSCPSPNLIKIGQGPALIKRVNKVSTILKELLKQDKYKVGIKLRLGLNALEVKQGKIFNMFEELEKIHNEFPNFESVTIHFKHAQERSSKEYNYSLLTKLASYKLPIIINGGIKNVIDAKRLIESIPLESQKNIKGIMIGREALKNPNCFLEINKSITGLSFKERSSHMLKMEFDSLCKEHSPKEIYLKTIKERVNFN